MFGRSDLNAWLAGFLTEHVDPVLGSTGFTRRTGARSSRRRTEYGAQKIEFFAYCRPPYAPGQAHMTMQVRFFMPEVMQLARQIFGPSLSSGRADPSFAGAVHLDSLRRQRPLGLWLFTDQAQLGNHAPEVQRALRTWVLPFLDASSTLEDFANGPAREDLRIEVIAAAYVQLGQPDNALGYLQQRATAHSDVELTLMNPLQLQAQQDRRTSAVSTLTAYLTDSGQPP
jgi:hypothetical protein